MPPNCKKAFILMFLAFFAAYGQQERVAILNTVDNNDSLGFNDLSYLTNRLRETAVKILPKSRYGIMTTESIIAFLGSQENARKVCNESSCLAEVGRKVSADYVAQARVGRFGKQLSINFQLYSTNSGNLVDSFTGNSEDIFGLLAIIDKEAPVLFRQMPDASSGSKVLSPSVEGGIKNVKYKIVVIGKQTWMAENLNYEAKDSKCYDNNSANCDKYGMLYDWNAAMKACPIGWHLPSDAEWNVLMKFINPSCSDNEDCAGAGTKLKATTGWNNNGNGTDVYNFSALPGGLRYADGIFSDAGNFGRWWSSSEFNSGFAHGRNMGYNYEDILYGIGIKSSLQSVRCLQD